MLLKNILKSIKNMVLNKCSLSVENLPYRHINKEDMIFSDKTLCIIGNGFDLAHGVKSSYYDFRNFLGGNSDLREIMEAYISKPDIWGDFENSLAHLDREMLINVIDDTLTDFNVKDDDDDDFSAADYHLAIEWAAMPAITIEQELPVTFRQWINKLPAANNSNPLKQIINTNARFINFNYTEFLETIYGVEHKNILYIHGCRKNKKEELVLGHGYNTEKLYEEWYDENKSRCVSENNPAKLAYFSDDDNENLDEYKSPIRYYAIQEALGLIEEYYDNSAKKTEDVLKQNKTYFETLYDVEKILVVGHSLSLADYPYFKEIINSNINKENLLWQISYYNNEDLKRINIFLDKMNIKSKQVTLFHI